MQHIPTFKLTELGKYNLNNKVILILSTLALCACNATTPEPYKKHLKPEQRSEYNGLKGWAQSEKDRVYLMHKESKRKCASARVSLAIATSENQTEEIEILTNKIKRVCN